LGPVLGPGVLAIWNLGVRSIVDPHLTHFEIETLARGATAAFSLWDAGAGAQSERLTALTSLLQASPGSEGAVPLELPAYSTAFQPSPRSVRLRRVLMQSCRRHRRCQVLPGST